MKKPTLEQYFKDNIKNKEIDHHVRVSQDSMGNIAFYIHPADMSGDTLDFIVRGNKLEQLFVGE